MKRTGDEDLRAILQRAASAMRKDGFAGLITRPIRHIIGPLRRTHGIVRMLRSDSGPVAEGAVPAGYRIRTFEKGDEAAWHAVMEAVAGPEYRLWRPLIDEIVGSAGFEAANVFFLDHGGGTVGTVSALPGSIDGKAAGCLHCLVVLPAHQGKGLGRLLTLRALRRFREQGYREVYLDTQPRRLPAITLYLGLGFRPVCRDAQQERVWNAVLRKIRRGSPAGRQAHDV